MLLSENEAQEICRKLLGAVTGEDALVSLTGMRTSSTAFARNEVLRTAALHDLEVSVTVTLAGRRGHAVTNQADDESLRRTVATAERNASVGHAEGEVPPTLGPQDYRQSLSWFADAAEAGPDAHEEHVRRSIERCRHEDLLGAGTVETGESLHAVATLRGLFGYQRRSRARFSTTVRTRAGDAAGEEAAYGFSLADLDSRKVVEAAVECCRRSRGAMAVEPGLYTVVFAPVAAADVYGWIFTQLDGWSTEVGETCFSQPGGELPLGKQLLSEKLSIWTDPEDPHAPAAALDDEGLAARRIHWVENGVLRMLAYAPQKAVERGLAVVPAPTSFILSSSATTLDGLVAEVDRGILVSRTQYVQPTDDGHRYVVGGVTGIGTFLIEHGKVTRPLLNLRFTEDVQRGLSELEALGCAARTLPVAIDAQELCYFPSLRIPSFRVEECLAGV
ncbi:MAG: hypothetical protein IT371_15980 [Deltaproteobacteria bacterium]|nr:hypothetical protein [Deltaproteobacteria bacterium]